MESDSYYSAHIRSGHSIRIGGPASKFWQVRASFCDHNRVGKW